MKAGLYILIFTAILASCKPEVEEPVYGTPYTLVIPQGLPTMAIPANNPMTYEGIALGKKLFYDPILSGDNTQSCASCHLQINGFTDPNQFSTGIDGVQGNRNAMPLINLGWQTKFFWDGGANGLESQVLGPITNPIEMHEDLANAIAELSADADYPSLFKAAFGTEEITSQSIMRAIAQFERTLISGNSKYDKYMRGEVQLTQQELDGMNLFSDMDKGDCVHCHVMGSTFSDFEFRNTGLDSIYADAGRYIITLNENDRGKFKTPSLRNIELTAPYMHDGRFQTLLECVQHYNTGFHYSQNLDPNLFFATKGRMTIQEMEAIVAFMKTLTDTEFITNPAFH
ncbi:MAG: cytochrome-c peroxidase [Bacteroidota bacterium]|jgi:cytochrome c peroxidase